MAQVLQQLAGVRPQNPDWLRSLNEAGAAVVRNTGWPTRKTEQWKYTSLRALEQVDYFSARGQAPKDLAGLAELCAIDNLDAHTLFFVNGIFSTALSRLQGLENGVSLVSFADADAQQSAQIREWLGSVVESDRHLFAAVNNQLLDCGAFLQVGKNVQLNKPVQVVWLTTANDTPFYVPQRLLVVLESNASAAVVEQFISTAEAQSCFTHGVTEVRLADGARCDHYRLHLEAPGALHAGGVYAALGANSHFNSFHLALGGVLKRIDVVINHNGPGADCVLNGVYLPRENQQIDYHTCIEHRVPHCTTQEVFRGIVADSAKAVFNGRIHIHPNAQKTLAQLSNKNLLLSDKAEVATKPELEIYADDVQCAHGATVARLDENALHYFRTRGVSQREAEVMLSFGFINELIDKLKLPAVVNYLRPVLTQWFARDPDLVRHLLNTPDKSCEHAEADVSYFDPEKIRRDFPILQQQVHGQPLVYLDSAATTQKPQVVLDALDHYYRLDNSNVHRAAHALADRATTAFENARRSVASFIGSPKVEQVIWTRGTTESINLVASSYGRIALQPGDKILVSMLEHHSNIVPWQLIAAERGASVVPIPIDARGDLDMDSYKALLDERVKIVAVNQVSNALGTVNPIKSIVREAHAVGARVLVDGAQAIAHFPVDVQDLGCDFYAFSGHKAFGPTGIGALWGREALLEQMPPYQGGGEMIETVTFAATTFNQLPYKFEAGTPDIAGAIGMAAALDYLAALDRVALQQYEHQLLQTAIRLGEENGLQRIGAPREAAGVYSFLIPGAHPADVGTLLDQQGVAVRTGHHCAQPLMAHLAIPGTVRASFSLYSNLDDVERLFAALNKVKTFLL